MKTEQSPTSTGPEIVYSHYDSRQVASEQCVAVHGLTYLLAGSLCVTEAGTSQTFDAGSLLFSRKNFLVKFTKQPAENGPFRAITVLFNQALLLEFSQQYGAGGQPPFVASPEAFRQGVAAQFALPGEVGLGTFAK